MYGKLYFKHFKAEEDNILKQYYWFLGLIETREPRENHQCLAKKLIRIVSQIEIEPCSCIREQGSCKKNITWTALFYI